MSIIRWILSAVITFHLASNIAITFGFEKGNWSYYLATFPIFIVMDGVLRFCFERKVADLHFNGEKVGRMEIRDEDLKDE